MGQRGRPRHPDVLTPRERDVLSLIREGLTNDQIAARLGITFETAKHHVSEILSKLDVNTREEAAAWGGEERRSWWQTPLRWAIVGSASVVLVGLALLAWAVLRSDGDSADAIVVAQDAGWPDCPPLQAQGFESGIHLLEGQTCEVTTLNGTGRVQDSPIWSQDNRQIAYLGELAGADRGPREIIVADIETDEVTQITDTPNLFEDHIAWTPDGGLVYSSLDSTQPEYQYDTNLVDYDLMFAPRGRQPRVVASGIRCLGDIAVSSRGEVAIVSGCPAWQTSLVDLESGVMSTVFDDWAYDLSWSPDGESLLFGCPWMAAQNQSAFCVKRRNEEPRKIAVNKSTALWSRDGLSIVLVGGSSNRIAALPADGGAGSAYAAPAGWNPLAVSWASQNVIAFQRCEYPPLPSPTVINGQMAGYAHVGPCPNLQTLSRDLVSGEERLVVEAHCGTLTEWSPNGARLAIVVPARPVCGG